MNIDKIILEKKREILAIYKEVDKAQDMDTLLALYTEYLKRVVCLSTNHPIFEENPVNFKYGNCYTYALGYPVPDIFKKQAEVIEKIEGQILNFEVGFISALERKYDIRNNSPTMLLDNFYKDCDSLNLRVYESDLNSFPTHNGYNIFLYASKYIKSNYDFHFLRFDSDYVLSEKDGYEGKIKRLNNIFEVSSCYSLVGVFEVVKPVIRERVL